MDALAGLLDGPRARGAFLLRVVLDPPWSLRIEDQAPLSLSAVLRGHAWVIPDHGEPVWVGPGDVVVVRGPDPYLVADDPASPAQVVIHPGGRCTTLEGRDLHDERDLGVRTWGTNPDGAHAILTGSYQLGTEVGRRLLSTLPHIVVVKSGECDTQVLPLLAAEVVRDDPAQEVVLDRLLDLLLIAVLRSWMNRHDAAPGWYKAHSDPVVGPAVRLIHEQPAHPWTVATLAAKVGASRAALARRFTELVGEPPMSYLTSWRLTLAADRLTDPDVTLAAVAREVGYSTPFALSTAFKRVRGHPPRGSVGAAEHGADAYAQA
jgi:AraC-like DNA-binding protein